MLNRMVTVLTACCVLMALGAAKRADSKKDSVSPVDPLITARAEVKMLRAQVEQQGKQVEAQREEIEHLKAREAALLK